MSFRLHRLRLATVKLRRILSLQRKAMSADFYFWLRFFDVALMLIGVALNYPDRKMLLLTVTAGAGVLMPLLPTDSSLFFYSQCLFIDLFVMLMALVIRAGSASVYVAQFGLALCALHVTGMVIGPYLS